MPKTTEVSILVKAFDEASKVLDKINDELNQTDDAAKKAGGGFGALKAGITSAVGIVTGVTASIVGAGVAVKMLTDDFTDYAMQVREVVTLIGATPEEASKLIQVADDVGVSFESMLGALEAGIRKGVEPSIENLGRLSDEYLKLEQGIERSAFLMENFGRSGTDLARVMELGSTKIKEMGDSIEGTGLLMTSQGIQSAEQYRIALDTLGDSVTGVKTKLGQILAPALTGIMNSINDAIGYQMQLSTVMGQFNSLVDKGLITQQQANEHIQYWIDGTITGAQATEVYNAILAKLPPTLAEIERETRTAGDSVSEGADSWGAYEQSIESALDKADNVDALKGMSDAAKQAAEEAAKAADKAAQAMVDAFWNVNPSLTSSITSAIEKVAWMEAGGRAAEQFFAAVMAAPADPNLGNNLVQSLILSLQASLASKGMNIWEAAGVLREEALKVGVEFTNAEAMAILNGESAFQPVDLPINMVGAEGEPFDLAAKVTEQVTGADWTAPAQEIGTKLNTALKTTAVTQAAAGMKTAIQQQLTPIFTGLSSAVEQGAFQLGRIAEQCRLIEADANGATAALRALQLQIDMLRGKKIDIFINITTVRTNITYNYTYDMTGGGGSGSGRPPGLEGIGHPFGDSTEWDPGYASGGFISSGQRAVVGERGPELFIPETSGYIIPNDDLKSMGGNTYILQIYSNAQREDLETDFRILESWARA